MNKKPENITIGNFIYVVTMHRWGDPERHSYVLGTYMTSLRARTEADNEEEARAGKYSAQIVKLRLNFAFEIFVETVKPMVRQPLIAPAPWARSDDEAFDPNEPYARMFDSEKTP